MSSYHLLDPEFAALGTPATDMTIDVLAARREDLNKRMASVPVPADQRVTFHEARVPGDGGAPEVRVLIHRPAKVDRLFPAILNIHGGGYIMGTADMNRASDHMLVAELNCVVISVDYRLAPETPHPGPLEDCYSALAWLHRHAEALGVDSQRIGVSGASAGGGLGAALALLARDRGEFPLAFQHLIYPMIDDRTAISTNPHAYTGEFVINAKMSRFGWASLLGDAVVGTADVSSYAAPARATDLARLPPAFIAVGALDLFLEEDLEYARRLTRAGVAVELHVYPGVPHAFQIVADARVTKNAQRDSLEALRNFTRVLFDVEPVRS